jgi:hypothetical protein
LATISTGAPFDSPYDGTENIENEVTRIKSSSFSVLICYRPSFLSVRDEEHHRRTVELFLLIVSLKSEAVGFQFSTLLQRMECRFGLRRDDSLKIRVKKKIKDANIANWDNIES